MKLFYSLLLFLLSFIVFSCDNATTNFTTTVYGSDTIQHIDLNPYLPNAEFEVEDILDSIKIVCFETKDESILSQVIGMVITEDRIFVYDLYQMGSIAIFDNNGKFIKRLVRGRELPFPLFFQWERRKIRQPSFQFLPPEPQDI